MAHLGHIFWCNGSMIHLWASPVLCHMCVSVNWAVGMRYNCNSRTQLGHSIQVGHYLSRLSRKYLWRYSSSAHFWVGQDPLEVSEMLWVPVLFLARDSVGSQQPVGDQAKVGPLDLVGSIGFRLYPIDPSMSPFAIGIAMRFQPGLVHHQHQPFYNSENLHLHCLCVFVI